MVDDERLHKAFQVTFTYVLVSVQLQLQLRLALALALALALVALASALLRDRGVRGPALYRSVFHLPSLTGGSVTFVVLWRTIFGTSGLVNKCLGLFGVHGQGWISEPATARSTLIVLNVSAPADRFTEPHRAAFRQCSKIANKKRMTP